MTPETTFPSLRDLELEDEDYNLLPPPPSLTTYSRDASGDRSRPSSRSASRPMTPTLVMHSEATPNSSPGGGGIPKRKSHWWNKSEDLGRDLNRGPVAWIAGHPQKLAYDVSGLISAKPMPELWNEDGNCFVHLFPRIANECASFKIDSAVFASSVVLTKLAFGDVYSDAAPMSGDRRQIPRTLHTRHTSLHDPTTPPLSPKRNGEKSSSTSSHGSRGRFLTFSKSSQETQLYLPINLSSDDAAARPSTSRFADGAGMEDLQTLIDYRNFFAFLCGQSLVATERRSSFFSIFMTIAGILKSYQFTNTDGSTYGEISHSSFTNYVEELGLADVRTSREKTIEGIVLGERMKNVLLYNEAFTHGVGKHNDLVSLKSPKFNMISPVSQNRLVRASMDLDKRVASIRLIMTDFDFPFIFSGIMSSKTSVERKEGVRFDAWKESFFGMRRFMLGLLKQRYGDWPPKASSKKNSLETSGLNRLVLKDMYHDLSSMYDLLVDRNNLTTRTIDGQSLDDTRDEPVVRGLRAVLSEYDRSSPPVKPPIPFDLPRLPTLRSSRKDFGTGDSKHDAKAMSKKIKDDEVHQILRASWNEDAYATPFVNAFREMEKRAAHGRTPAEIQDLRIGQWIFMYVLLQALPMLACDSPGLKWTQSVEYFLCAPPRSGVPWADQGAANASAGQRRWFSVGGAGGGVVSLPSDVVEHGVEGIYRRSHCWEMAEKWCAANHILSQALQMQQSSGGTEYQPAMPGRPMSVYSDRSSSNKRHSSFGIGLEALPLPAGITPNGSVPSSLERPRTPAHSVDASKTFDAILGTPDPIKTKKRSGKK